jgi:hypothetical protein
MIQIIRLFQLKNIVIVSFLICLVNQVNSQSGGLIAEQNIYSFSGIKNNHFVKKISNDWEILTPLKNISATVNLPLVVPKKINQISFSRRFQIPDSLRNRKLVIWFPQIFGNAVVNINNIQLSERLNLSSGFKIDIPMNLLNISGDNSLDIFVKRPESVDNGIPTFVKVFNPRQYLGIAGDIYLDWLPHVYYKDLKYKYAKNKLSFKYSLRMDREFTSKQEENLKIFCREELRDSKGKVIFSRYEYVDLKDLAKEFSRSTYIQNPLNWSPDSTEFYILRLTARSGTGLLALHEQKIGLREITFVNQQMVINNIPFRIRGINYRPLLPVYKDSVDYGSGQDIYIDQLKSDLTDIKNLGFNAIRFPDQIPHPYCFYLADSLGLYIFSEMGLWRIPERFFREDHLLQLSKKLADDIVELYDHHPSFIALCIGDEIPIHLPSVKKFMLILKGYLKQKASLSLYLIPINFDLISQRPITEFYMYKKYDHSLLRDFDKIVRSDIYQQGATLIFANVGFSITDHIETDNSTQKEERQSARYQRFFELISDQKNVGGYFLESYRDWPADSPARLGQPGLSEYYNYPYGLLSADGKKRDLYHRIPKLLKGEFPLTVIDRASTKKSNFFSITVFVFSIALLFIYRRNYQFRENLKRAMAHPYGFFVDLRDRRIISILNSTIIGLYTNFLVASLIAAYIYYMRDNLLAEEIISSILVPLNLKLFYLELMKSPFYITFAIWLVFYFLQLTIVILLKIVNLFATEKIRFKQYLAVCNWAGVPLILLFPLSLLSYHLMHYEMARPAIIIILILFFFWYNFRLGNGLRVLLSLRIYKIVLLLFFAYGSAIFAFGAIYESNFGLLAYLKLLNEAYPLF